MRKREVPPPGTYREAMDDAFALYKQASQEVAKTLSARRDARERVEELGMKEPGEGDRYRHSRYLSEHTQPESDVQVEAAEALIKAVDAHCKAVADRDHWKRVYREYADRLDARSEIADQTLRMSGGWVAPATGGDRA